VWYVINTTPIKQNKKRRYKSRVTIEILACLVTKGKLSRRMTESILKKHDHHVIIDAFKRLQNDGFIKISCSETGGRGRKKDIFEITKNGLVFLISEIAEPWKFWRAMMGYCWHADSQITVDQLKEFYKIFIDKYLKYPSEYGYCFELDLFNKVCQDWFQNRIQSADSITLDQIVLETLAINPKLTLEELVKKIKGFCADEIKKSLSHYTLIPRKPAIITIENAEDYRTGKIPLIQSWELLLYYVIKVRYNAKRMQTYELSLFGVLLVMFIIRNHDMGKLKYGLYNKDETFETYHDKIASNYKNSLPVILEKWYLLKRIFKIFAAYNFDIVLDRETRDNAIKSLSVIPYMRPDEPQEISITSGNKELYEAAKSIENISYRQLGHIQTKGIEESLNFVERLVYNFPSKPIQEARSIIRQKTKAVSQLIDEITVLLDPLSYDPKSFTEDLGKEFVEAEKLARLYDIGTLEKPFANQISFRYYLALNNEHHFEVMHPTNYYASTMERNYVDDDKDDNYQHDERQDEYSLKGHIVPLSPRTRLLSILRRDEDIKKWFSSWIANLENYQNDILHKTHNLHQKIEELQGISSHVVSR